MIEKTCFWIFQTGEPLHIDGNSPRPMRAMNLADELTAQGHKVVLWSSAFYHQEKNHRSTVFKCIRISELLEIRLIPSPGYKGNISLGRLWDHAILAKNLKVQLRKELSPPDVAFVGYPPIETAAVMCRYLKKNNIPTILDIKDQWPNIFLSIFPDKLKFIGKIIFYPYFYFAKRAMRDATHLSAMASGFLKWALKFSGRSDDTGNIVLPLTPRNNKIADAKIKQARQWWDDQGVFENYTPYIFFVGSHSQAFDFVTVFEAAKDLRTRGVSCEFVICGGGDLTSHFKEMAKGLTHVHFPGWVNRAQIAVLAERSIASLAPYNNTEDFMMSIPNKIVDSLSLELPILSPLKGEVRSLIETNKVGLFYGEGLDKTLSDCIELLVTNDKEVATMSRNALDLYNDRFSYDIVYGGLVSRMEQMAAGDSNHAIR